MKCSRKPKSRKNRISKPRDKMSSKKSLIYKLLSKKRSKTKSTNDKGRRKMPGKS